MQGTTFLAFLCAVIICLLNSSHAIGYCNVTSAMKANLAFGDEFSTSFLRLAFPQTAGYTLNTISTQIPREISAGLQLPSEQSVCVFDKINDVVPYVNLLLLPFSVTGFTPIIEPEADPKIDQIDLASDITVTDFALLQVQPETRYLNQLWSALGSPTTSFVSTTTYLKTNDISKSTRSSGQLIRMRYCESYSSLQDVLAECPDAQPVKETDESLSWLSGVLLVIAVFITFLSATILWFLYRRYERQADYKTAVQIKKTRRMQSKVATSPESAQLSLSQRQTSSHLPLSQRQTSSHLPLSQRQTPASSGITLDTHQTEPAPAYHQPLPDVI